MDFVHRSARFLPKRTHYALRRVLRGGPGGAGITRPRRVFKGNASVAAFDSIIAENLRCLEYRRLRKGLIPTPLSTELLFDYACALGATIIVELGTDSCFSTDALVRAASLMSGKVFSFDPCMYVGYVHPKYRPYWKFNQITGEDGYAVWDKSVQIDLLYIDTDPHSYDQTIMWLSDYWIKSVRGGGLILLDDSAEWEQSVHGFGVLEAVRQFVEQNQERVEFFLIEDNAPPSHGVAVVKLVSA